MEQYSADHLPWVSNDLENNFVNKWAAILDYSGVQSSTNFQVDIQTSWFLWFSPFVVGERGWSAWNHQNINKMKLGELRHIFRGEVHDAKYLAFATFSWAINPLGRTAGNSGSARSWSRSIDVKTVTLIRIYVVILYFTISTFFENK